MHYIFRKKSLIVLNLFQYKYGSEYFFMRTASMERTGVESLNFLTLWLKVSKLVMHGIKLRNRYIYTT